MLNVLRCPAVNVTLRPTALCSQDIPVLFNSREIFVDPVHHILKPNSTFTKCSHVSLTSSFGPSSNSLILTLSHHFQELPVQYKINGEVYQAPDMRPAGSPAMELSSYNPNITFRHFRAHGLWSDAQEADYQKAVHRETLGSTLLNDLQLNVEGNKVGLDWGPTIWAPSVEDISTDVLNLILYGDFIRSVSKIFLALAAVRMFIRIFGILWIIFKLFSKSNGLCNFLNGVWCAVAYGLKTFFYVNDDGAETRIMKRWRGNEATPDPESQAGETPTAPPVDDANQRPPGLTSVHVETEGARHHSGQSVYPVITSRPNSS